MELSFKKKEEIIRKFRRDKSDTGSPEVQIALLTERIKDITEHLKRHKKDFHSRRGLEILASRRKRLLNYLRRRDYERFKNIKKELKLRV